MSQIESQKKIISESWAVRMADSILQKYPQVEWKWHYEHGLIVKAIASIQNSSYRGFVRNWVDHFVTADGEINSYRVNEFNLDQVYPGRLLFLLFEETGDKRYEKALHLIKWQLEQQPRTSEGGFWHKKIYPSQMWLDGLYMAEPFNARYAVMFNRAGDFSDICRQFFLMERHARDPKTGLLYHGWDESKVQKWADPVTGCSPHFWGRALGWYVMAIVDVLECLPVTHSDYPEMLNILVRLSHSLVRYQDAATGLWYQIVDLPDRPGNYLESSVSAMLSYGFAKAVRNGWLAVEYLSSARRAYYGLLEKMVKLDSSGMLTLENTCSVAGLGGEPYRDGSFDYYTSEPKADNDFKGVGPFILAALEIEKCEGIIISRLDD